jgi:anti-anti-sigma factor
VIEMMSTNVADGRLAATASVAAMSSDQGDRRTVTVGGRLIVRHVGEVRTQLAEALDVDHGHVVVDLTDLEALDTAGLVALTAPLMASRRRGVRVTLVGPRSPEAGRTLTLTGLVPLLAGTP